MGFDGLFSSSDFHLEIFLYSFSRSTFKIFDKLNINDKDYVVCILNNNPFIKSELIKKSYEIFR